MGEEWLEEELRIKGINWKQVTWDNKRLAKLIGNALILYKMMIVKYIYKYIQEKDKILQIDILG